MTFLRPLLRSARIPVIKQQQAVHAMQFPWCWPRDADLVARARSLGIEAPPAPAPGEMLLVSVSSDLRRSALWRLRPLPGRTSMDSFTNDAVNSLVVASRIVTRHALFIFSLDAIQQVGWRAELLAKDGPFRDEVLDGPSYGLSMLLAYVSLLAGRPAPTNLVASATIDDASDRLGPVDGLREKITIVTNSALGVTRMIVAAEQRDLAATIAQECGSGLEILGARTIGEAVAIAFADVPAPWDDLPSARRAAKRVFDLAVKGAGVLDWSRVASTAEELAATIPEDCPEHAQALFARQVAQRHFASHPAAIPWPEKGVVGTSTLRYLAHVVQSAADAGSPLAAEYTRRALEHLPVDGDFDAAHLELLGAIGRALAMRRDYEPATDALRRAVEGWFRIGEEAKCSYALSEWVRVAGIRRDQGDFDETAQWIDGFGESSAHDISRAFVRFAVARASVQLGRPGDALAMLTDGMTRWLYTPAHLQRSRARWRANALEALGRVDEAARERRALELEQDEFGQPYVEARLARIDAALAADGDAEAELQWLRAERPQGTHWLFDDGASGARLARRIADEYPY